MLTTKQIELARDSYESVAKRSGAFADEFYKRLFGIQPALRLLFPDDMKEQKEKLMEMLGAAVLLLDQPERLTPILEESGRRHLLYGVRERDYEAVGTALLETLRETAGENYDPETAMAWRSVYELISETMICGARLLQNADDDQTIDLLAATIARPSRGGPTGLSRK